MSDATRRRRGTDEEGAHCFGVLGWTDNEAKERKLWESKREFNSAKKKTRVAHPRWYMDPATRVERTRMPKMSASASPRSAVVKGGL